MTGELAMPATDINSKETSKWDIYIAAGVGAFILCISDLIKNGNSSTVFKISDVIRTYLTSALGEGALPTIVLMVFLGIVLCWVHAPNSRIEGFTRGFSVFAILTVVSPVQTPEPLDSGNINQTFTTSSFFEISPMSFFISSATARPFSNNNAESDAEGAAVIIFPSLSNNSKSEIATITLRDAKTEKVIARQDITGSQFKLKKPYGDYILEVEKSGFRRTEVPISITENIAAYKLSMEKSSVPLGLQRLVGFSEGKLEKSQAETYKQEGANYSRQKDYKLAIEKYDEALKLAPNDAQTHNYKGYAFLREEQYDAAIASFKKAHELSPQYYYARLNLAKAHCAKGDVDTAKSVLLSKPALSNDEISTTIKDHEFKKLCSEIVADIKAISKP